MDDIDSESSASVDEPLPANIARQAETLKRKALYEEDDAVPSQTSELLPSSGRKSVRSRKKGAPDPSPRLSVPKTGKLLRLGIKSPVKPSSDIGEGLPVIKRAQAEEAPSPAEEDSRVEESANRVKLLSSARVVREAWDEDWVALAAAHSDAASPPDTPKHQLMLPSRAPSTRWTEEETRLLLEGMSHYIRPHGNWKNISVHFLQGRKSNMQCKDKYVNLVKSNRLGRRSDGHFFLTE